MEWLDAFLNVFARGWVGSTIGLLGIVAAVVTYLLTRQRTLLVYRRAGERLLGLKDGGLPSDITVQFRGQNIPRLTRSLIVIWNAGEKTITDTDLVKTDPLRIVFPLEGSVLAVTVLKPSRDVIDFKCSQDSAKPNEVKIAFAFLDPGDGAAVEVLHTSESRNAEVVGTVRGLPKGIQNRGEILRRRVIHTAVRTVPRLMAPRIVGWLVVVVGALFAGMGLFLPFSETTRQAKSDVPVGVIVASAGVLYMALGFVLLWISRRRYPKNLHVEELE